MRHGTRLFVPLLASLIVTTGPCLRSQEVPHPAETLHEQTRKETEQKTEEEKRTEELQKYSAGHFSVRANKGEPFLTPQERERMQQQLASTVHIRWRENKQGGFDAFIGGKLTTGADGKPLTAAEVQSLYVNKGRAVVHEGDLTHNPQWEKAFAPFERTVIHDEKSANQTPEQIAAAAYLGERGLNASNCVVLNALPHKTGSDFNVERTRMRIGGEGDEWQHLQDTIHEQSAGLHTMRATKDALFQELNKGTGDVVMIYAHFDGTYLYLPDAEGGPTNQNEGRISMEEFRKGLIDRQKDGKARKRVIVLVACNGASPVKTEKGYQSIASIFLEKGIGGAVFASNHPFNASDIPTLLKNLSSGKPLRQSFTGSLSQIVELGPDASSLAIAEHFASEHLMQEGPGTAGE